MKGLFGRSSRPTPLATGLGASVVGQGSPSPERRLAVHATPTGLLIVPKPHHHSSQHHQQQSSGEGSKAGKDGAKPGEKDKRLSPPPAPIHIAWGKEAKMEELHAREAKSRSDAAVEDAEIQIYGIVGLLRVFNRERCRSMLAFTSET
jgi:hypothetical protein